MFSPFLGGKRDKTHKSVQGLRRNIFIEMSDENPDLNQPAAEIANISASSPFLSLEASNGSFGVDESEWVADTSVEVSTGLVQDGSSLVLVPDDANLHDSKK